MAKVATLRLKESGSFKSTFKFLKDLRERHWLKQLDHFGKLGVKALAEATPRDTGKTAESWQYEVITYEDNVTLRWYNTNVVDGWFNVAVMLQYGHGTRNGGWVEGRDYINPAIQPIIDKAVKGIWEEVTKSV